MGAGGGVAVAAGQLRPTETSIETPSTTQVWVGGGVGARGGVGAGGGVGAAEEEGGTVGDSGGGGGGMVC